MDDVIKYVTTNWPGIAIFIFGIVVLYFMFKTALDTQKATVETLRTSNQDLREEVTGFRVRITEINQRNDALTLKVQTLEQDLSSYRERVESHLKDLGKLITQLKKQLDESFDRFNHLSDTVSDVAAALQSFDGQVENWSRIESILNDHGIQLENIKSLVERMSGSDVSLAQLRSE